MTEDELKLKNSKKKYLLEVLLQQRLLLKKHLKRNIQECLYLKLVLLQD
jgi:hypothetical protein